ncbi:MAG: hypothetical protein LBK25_02805 [Treponema sp.]|jgi:hypothetical protein|nr:hypothetical protein [Treponema sp.]
MANDYLNLTDALFNLFFRNLNRYLDQKCEGTPADWLHIPVIARQELKDAYTEWSTSYEKTTVPHTPVDTEAKNEMKVQAKAKIRPFVNVYLREDQSAVSDIDRTAMGIPNKDKTPTTHPAPDVKPETAAAPSGKGRHTVTALNPRTGDHKRPDLIKGVAFAHRIRNADDPKNNADDMPSVFQTRTVRDFQWTEADYGKTVDYATAYENEGGKRGPWSDVISIIIA